MNHPQKPQIIFILGGPGSGKGTQCNIMVNQYGYIHYSTGDLLRQFIKTDCDEARKIRNIMSQGKLAPSEMLVDVIKKNIFKSGTNNNVYLIDGFPRSTDNYQAWKKVIGNQVQIKTLIYLQCNITTLQIRLLQRGRNSGRQDDNLDIIRKRFKTYHQQTMPFLQHYQRYIGDVHLVNGQNNIQVVTNEIKDILIQHQLL